MKHSYIPLLALWLLPMVGRADSSPNPWAASAQAPTSFAVPIGQDTAVMAQAVSLLSGWKGRDSHMYPMPIEACTSALILTQDPTAMGLFGVKITDTHTAGIALIAVETSAYEGKIFQVSQQRHDANKRAHLLAYLLEQSAGVSTAPPPVAPPDVPAAVPPPTVSGTPVDDLQQTLRHLQSQLDAGQLDAALATLDVLRAEVIAHRSQAPPASR